MFGGLAVEESKMSEIAFSVTLWGAVLGALVGVLISVLVFW
jgi:hypothetical protein